MKTLKWLILPLIAGGLLLAFTTLPAQGLGPKEPEKFEALYKEARDSYVQGDYQEAIHQLGLALELHPYHRPSRNMLAEAKKRIANDPGRGTRQTFEKIILKEVSFSEVEISAALQFFKNAASEQTKGQVKPNFIVDGFGDDEPLITMDLRGVPLATALQYACDLARARVQYDKHAVVVRPVNKIVKAPKAGAPAQGK